jgi:hypothetical protein
MRCADAGDRVRPVRRLALILCSACVVFALLVPATSFALHGLRFFHTADNNIACGMVKGQKKKRHKHPRFPGEARCDLKSHTWVAPPKPRYCDVDWGFGVGVGDKGLGNYVCAGDTVAEPTAPILNAGQGITLGRYTCTVPVLPATTVRCQNNLTMHGFEVSADSVSLF